MCALPWSQAPRSGRHQPRPPPEVRPSCWPSRGCTSATRDPGLTLLPRLSAHTTVHRLISVYRLGGMPIQSCGQSVGAPRGKAGARGNARTGLRAKRQRSAREAIYRNRPIIPATYIECAFASDEKGTIARPCPKLSVAHVMPRFSASALHSWYTKFLPCFSGPYTPVVRGSHSSSFQLNLNHF